MRRKVRWAALVGVTLIGTSAGVFFGLDHVLHRSPRFYAEAVAVAPAQQKEAGQQFERNLLAMHNDLQQGGRWKRVFTDRQINGWLAVDLPEKFPDLLPPSIRQPRVALTPRQLQIAFHYESEQLSTIVSLTLEIGLADEPNTLVVRVRKAQAGWVPLPLKDFLDHISAAARHADLRLRWTQIDGDPVALITLGDDASDKTQESFVLEMVEIGQGKLTVTGQTNVAKVRQGND